MNNNKDQQQKHAQQGQQQPKQQPGRDQDTRHGQHQGQGRDSSERR